MSITITKIEILLQIRILTLKNLLKKIVFLDARTTI